MKAEDLLKSAHRQQKAEKRTLRFARVAIVLSSAIVRCLELFGSPKRRQKRRQFREKIQGLKAEEKTLRYTVDSAFKNAKGFDGIEAVYEFRARHSGVEDDKELADDYAGFRAMRQESETLYGIRKDAGKDLAAAAESYRDYITAHPESSSAHSYLAGVLQQSGDLEGSLSQYREAQNLAGGNSIGFVSARLQVGEVLRKRGETDLAVAEFQAIIDEATMQTKALVPMAYCYLGDTLNEAGDRQAARDAWKQVVQWDKSGRMGKKAQERLKANP